MDILFPLLIIGILILVIVFTVFGGSLDTEGTKVGQFCTYCGAPLVRTELASTLREDEVFVYLQCSKTHTIGEFQKPHYYKSWSEPAKKYYDINTGEKL